MERISTNLTLFFKFFLPIFWMVFVGALTLALFFLPLESLRGASPLQLRLIMLFVFLSGAVLFAFTLMRLKRVEASPDFLYVTNYFKTVRYPTHQVTRMLLTPFFNFTLVRVSLRSAGSFGAAFFFLASTNRLEAVLAAYPAWKALSTAP